MEILYAPTFVRQYKRLEPALQEEVKEKIALLGDRKNHRTLKVHKLTGRLKGRYSFSVNYRIRIVFIYTKEKDIILLAVGGHEVYDQ